MTTSPNRSWDPRRRPRTVLALTLILVALAAFIFARTQRSIGAAADESSRDTMCLASRIGLACRQ